MIVVTRRALGRACASVKGEASPYDLGYDMDFSHHVGLFWLKKKLLK